MRVTFRPEMPDANPWNEQRYECGMCGGGMPLVSVVTHAIDMHGADQIEMMEIDFNDG